MNGYEWAKVCSDNNKGNWNRRTDLLAWADWELDRGDPFHIEPGLRKIANYWEDVPRRPWFNSFIGAWTWTDRPDLKYASHLQSKDWERLSGKWDSSDPSVERYLDPLAAFLDLCYVLAPFPVLIGKQEEYQ
jgi:hypothetical protein